MKQYMSRAKAQSSQHENKISGIIMVYIFSLPLALLCEEYLFWFGFIRGRRNCAKAAISDLEYI